MYSWHPHSVSILVKRSITGIFFAMILCALPINGPPMQEVLPQELSTHTYIPYLRPTTLFDVLIVIKSSLISKGIVGSLYPKPNRPQGKSLWVSVDACVEVTPLRWAVRFLFLTSLSILVTSSSTTNQQNEYHEPYFPCESFGVAKDSNLVSR